MTSQTILEPAFVFEIEWCLADAGYINKDFLHWDFTSQTILEPVFCFWNRMVFG